MENNLSVPSQAQIKKWTRLADGKFRREEGLFTAEGVKVVDELLSSRRQTKAILLLPEKRKYWEKIIAKAPAEMPRYALTRTQWQKISQDKEPEGIMALVAMPQGQPYTDVSTLTSGNTLILHEISNPGNLGALMRSALWFGFDNIILSTGSVEYTHPKVVRTSMGSLFHLNIVADIPLKKVLPEIKKSYYLIGSSVRRGVAPHLLQKKAALLLGSESHGLPDDLLAIVDELWCIPGSGKVDSLSLPQAAAVLMYECAKK
ncbi:MAG: RNA methyltransferase [Syntrophaceae bacterium]|nr:RNA methyltransferase [Syntrophaceae bacterium]